MEVRVCFRKRLNAYGEDFDSDGYARRLSGDASEYFESVLGLHVLRRHNVSIRFYESNEVGTEKNESGFFDGCIGTLQSGFADVSSKSVAFPLIARNVTHGPVLFQYENSFVSAFKPNNENLSPDLMDFISGYSMPVISVFLLTCILLAMTMRLVRRPKLSLFRVTAVVVDYMLGSHQSGARIRSKLLLFLLIYLMFMYRIHTYMIMKTQQVVATPPEKLTSVKQLIDRQIPFVWTLRSDYEPFRKSNNRELKQLHDLSIKRGMESVLLNRLLKKENDEKLLHGLLQQKHVIVRRDPDRFMRMLCSLMSRHGIDIGDNRLMASKLENSPTPLAGILISEHFERKNASLAKLLRKAIRVSAVEAQLPIAVVLKMIRKVNEESNSRIVSKCQKQIGEEVLLPQLFTPNMTSMSLSRAHMLIGHDSAETEGQAISGKHLATSARHSQKRGGMSLPFRRNGSRPWE